MIISNPPFFSRGLAASSESRSLARKGEGLPINKLVEQVDRLLADNGTAHIILPMAELASLERLLEARNMFPKRISKVFPTKEKPAHRFLISFGRKEVELEEEEICIQVGGANEYSEAYKSLTQQFYKHSLT